MNKRAIFTIIIFLIFLLVFSLFFIRLISPREIDDISPEIPCSQKYLEKSDILWVIPKYDNKPISANKEWCEYILSLNKTLGLHGVYHEFEEFNTNVPQIAEYGGKEYLQQGINIFEECFGFKPEMFKPPQLKISDNNKILIEENNMKLKTRLNQLTHKVYHCDDSGMFKNWVVDLI